MSWSLDEAVAYYKRQGAPSDQSAVISLLQEIQQESGGRIPAYQLSAAAKELGVQESLLRAIVRRIPRLHLADVHCLEVCAGPNCAKHAAIAKAAERIGNGKITVKYVPCMRQCGKGPNIRWDGQLYNRADETLIRKLTEEK